MKADTGIATCADCRRVYPDGAPWSCPDCGAHDAYIAIDPESWLAEHPGIILNREPTLGPWKSLLVDNPAVPDGEAAEIPAEIRSYSDWAIECREAA